MLKNPARLFPVLLLLLFLIAAGVRGAGLKLGMPEFQPVRQYHSALIARYLQHLGDTELPVWEREIIDQTVQPIHEPPVMETLAIAGFHLLGQERMWLPRAIAMLAWLAGAAVLYRLLARVFTPAAALAGVAFFLFLPYGIGQSLSFQPDSLALALALAGILAIYRFHLDPTRKRLIAAAIWCAVALMVKAQMVFLIAGVYAALGLRRGSLWRLLTHRENWLFAVIVLLPSVLYVSANLALGGISAQRGIIPAALLQPGFYVSWLYNLDRVVGYPALLLALLGTLLLRDDKLALALGLWVGYALLGMVFTFHFATHSYYHVAALPAVAFGLAGLAGPVLQALAGQNARLAVPGMVGLVVLTLALVLAPTLRGFGKIGVDGRAEAYAEIGRLVDHSRRTLMLTEHEGFPLMYYAKIAGEFWPTQWSLAVEKVGLKNIASRENEGKVFVDDVGQRFARFAAMRPEYFVVTNMEEFAASHALERFLAERYPLLAASEVYRIYDLRSPLTSERQAPAHP